MTLRPPSLTTVMNQNAARMWATTSSSVSNTPTSAPSRSTTSSVNTTNSTSNSGGSDLFAPWAFSNNSTNTNSNTTNINPATHSVGYYLNQGMSYDQATKALADARSRANTNNNTPDTLRQQQEEIAKQQQEAQRQQQEMQSQMMQNQQQQNQQMQQQQMDAMKAQNDAWVKRQEEMQRNMQRMQAEEADFMTNREKFERMTGYATKNEQERKVVDDYWNNNSNIAKPRNAGDYYNDIKNGVAVANHEKNRPEYIQAEATYGRIQKYKSMNSGQLANLFKTGELTSGDLALLHKENPSLAMDIAFTNSINNSGQVNFDADQLAMSNDIIKNWHTDMQNDERQNLLSNALSSDPNIANAMADTKRKADKLGELQKTVLSVSEEVDKELEGKNAPKSYAEALKMKRSSAIHTAIASAQIDYSNAMNYQRDLIENKKYDIDYQRQLENRKFQVGQAIFMGRENQRLSQENARYDMELGLQKAQMEFEQKIAQDQHIQNNPRLATQQMIESYRKQGIHAMRSDAEIIADIETQVANGRSLGEALTDLNKAFQNKDEYKTLQRLHNGQMSDAEKIHTAQQFAERNMSLEHGYSMAKMRESNALDIQNTMLKYDLSNRQDQQKAVQELVLSGQMSSAEANATMRNINGNWKGANGAELLFAEDGTFIPSTMYTAKTGTNGKGGIECAEYISRMTGLRVGSTWEEKKKFNPEKTGKIGSIIVWQPSKTGAFAKYGHAGIIIGEEGNNWIVKNANYGVDGKISTIKVPKNIAGAQYRSTNLLNSIGMSGGLNAGDNGWGANSVSRNEASTGVSPEAQHWLNVINKGEIDLSTALTKIGSSKDAMVLKNEIITAMNAQGGRTVRDANDPAVLRMNELANDVGRLLSDTNQMNNVSGGIQWANLNWINKGKSDYLANVQRLLEDKTLQEIVDRKNAGATFGALSDTELKALQSASSVLAGAAQRDEKGKIIGFDISEAEMKRQLEILQRWYLRAGQQMMGGSSGWNWGSLRNFATNLVTSTGLNLSSYFQ